MTRGYNFGAGPATLPQEIMTQAQQELLDWEGQGMSVMEISHRSDAFESLLQQAETDLRQLLTIPDNYHVLFINGSARTQFAMMPMNCLLPNQSADYLVTGTWSKMAYEEADKLACANLVASGHDANFLAVPSEESWVLSDEAAYFYYTPNETITGLAINQLPSKVKVPVIADMTSCFLSQPIDVTQFGAIIAGSQKNIGPAGMTVVIIRDDLLVQSDTPIPTMLDYRTHIDSQSMYATPATFNCYMAGLMFKWLLKQGGVSAIAEINQRKAKKLYDSINTSDFYDCPIAEENRSVMNVAFTLQDPSLDAEFLAQAAANNLLALKGHRSVGGMRASIYNSMPESGVDALIDFMASFEANAMR